MADEITVMVQLNERQVDILSGGLRELIGVWSDHVNRWTEEQTPGVAQTYRNKVQAAGEVLDLLGRAAEIIALRKIAAATPIPRDPEPTTTWCPTCDNEYKIEVPHPRLGASNCPEPTLTVPCPQCQPVAHEEALRMWRTGR